VLSVAEASPRVVVRVMEFLHPDNLAGRTLLTLVARGSAVISELLRLSDHIPPVFLHGLPVVQSPAAAAANAAALPQGSQQQQIHQSDPKYEQIMLDFRYLKQPEVYDSVIDNNVVSGTQ
jgi:WASH complex subunit strumpellin